MYKESGLIAEDGSYNPCKAIWKFSEDKIDITIIKLVIWLVLAGILILLIAISISLKFADTLIEPLAELKKFANELAHGNYNIKLKPRAIVDDEIGELAQTFEYMADEINKSERLKDEFISSISHELRTPLTSIKGWSETLGYEGIGKEELDICTIIYNYLKYSKDCKYLILNEEITDVELCKWIVDFD